MNGRSSRQSGALPIYIPVHMYWFRGEIVSVSHALTDKAASGDWRVREGDGGDCYFISL